MRRSLGTSSSSRGMKGGILRAVGRAVGSGVGAVQESLSTARPKPTNVFSVSSASSSLSSSVTLPVSAASTVHGWRSSSCFIDDDWEPIEEEEEKEAVDNGFSEYFVFGSVPSKDEVEDAVSAIQQILVPVASSQIGDDKSPSSPHMETVDLMTNSTDLTLLVSSDESESDWIEPAMQLYNLNAMQSQVYNNVYDTFRLLQINPSVQRMVISLSSDEAVWNAVMKNEAVHEVREAFYAVHAAEKDQSLSSEEKPIVAVKFLRWILDNTKANIMEFISNITKLVNELFRGPDKEKTTDSFEDTLRSTLMLSVVVLLVIVVTRVQGA